MLFSLKITFLDRDRDTVILPQFHGRNNSDDEAMKTTNLSIFKLLLNIFNDRLTVKADKCACH